jgi:hypothetical protein
MEIFDTIDNKYQESSKSYMIHTFTASSKNLQEATKQKLKIEIDKTNEKSILDKFFF